MTDVYVASAMPTAYPLKLQKPSTVSPRVRETAETFIMDSGIGDDVSNAEVLDLAEKYDADYVVAKDYLHDQDRTTESVREFIDLYNDHDCTATPMIPLQPPFHEHYNDLPGFDHYVLGGMAGDNTSTRQCIRWIERFDDVAPDDAYVHGLGIGGGYGIVRAFAGTDTLDSIDCSTPEQAAMFGKVLDERLKQSEVLAFGSGEGKTQRTYPLAEFNSWQVQDVWNFEDSAARERGELFA